MSAHHQRPGPQPRHRAHPAIQAIAAITSSPSPHRQRDHHGRPGVGTGHGQPWPPRPYGHPHRVGFDVRRAVLRRGLRQIRSAASHGDHQLLRRGQQRRYRRVQRRKGEFRRLRRAHDRQRASSRPRRSRRAGARRPGRRRRGLQPEPPGGRQVAPDRPGDRPHLLGQITRWDDPAITALTRASASRARRSPLCTAPTAAAPPTSSTTTCPASTRPGRPRSAPARRLTRRRGRGRRQRQCGLHGV